MSGTLEVLAHVRETHGVAYGLVRRLTGGIRSGAYEIRAPDGRRAVLKWSTDRTWAAQVLRAAPVVERVRAAGWPTPRWLAVGVTGDGCPYQIQEYVDGTPLSRPDPDLLLDLVDRQRGLDPDPDRNWSDYVREVVAAAVPDTDPVLDRLLIACRAHADLELPRDDLVHGDLNPGNVLVAGGRVAGVIDIEALGSGTRVYDLAGLLATVYVDSAPAPVRSRFLAAALSVAGPGAVLLCLAASYADMLGFLAARDTGRIPGYRAGVGRLLDDLLSPP